MELPFLIFLCIMPAVFTALIQFFVYKKTKNKIIRLLPTIILLSAFTIEEFIYSRFEIGDSMLSHILMCFAIGSVAGIPLYFLSKKIKIRYIVTLIVSLYCLVMIGINASAPANLLYDPLRIEHDGTIYIEYDDSEYPAYGIAYDDSEEGDVKRTYVKSSLFSIEYIVPYSENFDKNQNFVWLYSYDRLMVKEDFVFPTIENNEVEAVWMSASSSDEDHITDKETVEKIVDCIKSNGKIELDKVIVGYIKKRSWDNHCIHIKYKDYPILEDYHIEETEDGRYILKQYTPEEYDAPFWEDAAH